MSAKPKSRNGAESGDAVEDSVLATSIRNGEDLGPIVRNAFQMGHPEPLLQQLKVIAKRKEMEIEELCKMHYEDFILAVDELRGVLVDAEELKGELSGDNLKLQEVGTALLLRVEELLETYTIRKNVTEALKMSENCMLVLELCAKFNDHISKGQLYPALKTADSIERNYLQNIPVNILRMVIEKTIPVIKAHVQKQVISQVNEWLEQIRSLAKSIGQTAIGHTASSRQKDKEKLERQRKAEEESLAGFGDSVYTLDVEEIEEDCVLEFNLTPLYRAFHIYKFLGNHAQFQDYYYENRMMQLKLDLQVPSSQPFIETYQSYFAQIVGHFIVDDRVLRTAGGLLIPKQIEVMWDTAVTKMVALLNEQFSCMDSTTHLLLVKDYVTLLTATLRHYGYEVGPLIEVLDNCQGKYQNLLLEECRQRIVNMMGSDTYEQMVINNDTDYQNNVLFYHLQTSDLVPPFPYVAPFSIMVPDTCRTVCSFIKSSVDYLSYGGQANSFEMVAGDLDKMLTDVLNEALLSTIHNDTIDVSKAMQIAANIAFLERACDFFVRHAAQLCGIPARAVGSPQAILAAKVVLRSSREAAYQILLNLVNAQIDEFMVLTDNINWVMEELPRDENDYINEVIIFLGTILSTDQQMLPLDALYKVGTGALEHVSNAFVSAFLSDTVKRFNINAIVGINTDLEMLENFVDERFHITGLSDIYRERSFRDCLIEARQLINLLLSSQPENFMDSVTREKNYDALDFKKVASICEKFKDAPDSIFGSLSSRNMKPNSRKKSMDVLKKRLKDFS